MCDPPPTKDIQFSFFIEYANEYDLHFIVDSQGVLCLQGVLFADYGSDFDSGQTVLGDPAGVRGKPGNGYGYGGGVRIDTSLGAVRLEYGFNDRGLGRFHLGIGSY